MSGITNKAVPFSGPTNNLHVSCFLCLICTLHTPSWECLVLLYVLNIPILFMVLFNCSVVVLGKQIL